MAPLIAALLKAGLPLIGNAVLAKGKEYIEEKAGVKLQDGELSEPEYLKLKQFQLENETELRALQVEDNRIAAELEKARLADTASAREMNASIQNSKDATWLAKNFPYVLDMVIIGGAVLLGLCLFAFKIPTENKELAYTAFGVLLGLASTVVNFHRGSSGSSKEKDSIIAALMKK